MQTVKPTIGDNIHSSLVAFAEKFTEIPAGWLPKIAGEPMPLPIWGTVFLVTNQEQSAIIQALMSDLENDATFQEVSGCWQAVGDTGFLACLVDGYVFLGVDGAGYCFYQAHWKPLYQRIYSD